MCFDSAALREFRVVSPDVSEAVTCLDRGQAPLERRRERDPGPPARALAAPAPRPARVWGGVGQWTAGPAVLSGAEAPWAVLGAALSSGRWVGAVAFPDHSDLEVTVTSLSSLFSPPLGPHTWAWVQPKSLRL